MKLENGDDLKHFREKYHFSRKDLATCLDRSESRISHIECYNEKLSKSLKIALKNIEREEQLRLIYNHDLYSVNKSLFDNIGRNLQEIFSLNPKKAYRGLINDMLIINMWLEALKILLKYDRTNKKNFIEKSNKLMDKILKELNKL